MRSKYSPRKGEHPIQVAGIRPGEKIHEILVNEYEMQRATEESEYFVVHPEYRVPEILNSRTLGEEYTSENTHQLESLEQVFKRLDEMTEAENYE